MTPYNARACTLGEGPLWHPLRNQLFWFDIPADKLLSRDGDAELQWRFDHPVSAAGWADHSSLLVASATGLWHLQLDSDARHFITPREEDLPSTQSNDGRVDPMGGLWIGTMGRAAEKDAGSIYRYYKGELRRLFTGLTIPNAISFSPDTSTACFCDTSTRQVLRVALDGSGWPVGSPEVFLDLSAEGLNPDRADYDAEGRLWIAMWGASAVRAFAPDATLSDRIELPAAHPTCPAFGGKDFSTLFETTAQQGVPQDQLGPGTPNGLPFALAGDFNGNPAPQVEL